MSQSSSVSLGSEQGSFRLIRSEKGSDHGSGRHGRANSVASSVVTQESYENEVLEAEIDQMESEARLARLKAQENSGVSDDDALDSNGRRKRKRGDDVESEPDPGDELVPFSANGFCLGCECKQSVFLIGPVQERRRADVESLYRQLGRRYNVELVYAPYTTVEKPKLFSSETRASLRC